MKFEWIKEQKKFAAGLWRESRGVRRRILGVALGGCLSVLLSLLFIWITKTIVDQAVSAARSISTGAIVALAGCLLLQLLVPAARRRIETVALARYSNNLRRRLLDRLLQSKWGGKGSLHTGDAINRMQKDVDTIAALTCSTLPGIAAVLLQLLGSFIFIILLDARLAWVLVFIMPFALLASKVYIKRTRLLTAEIRREESNLQTFLQESLHNRTLLSTLMSGDMLLGKFDSRQDSLTGKIVKRTDISIYSNMAVTVGFMAGYTVTFLWSAYGLTTGAVSFGMMTAFLQLVGQIQRPAVDLSRRVPAFINASVSLERITGVLSLPVEDFSSPDIPRGCRVGLRLKEVSYSYPDEQDKPVVERLSHDFKPGSVTGIIGPTGIGKTTLIRLLLGLVEPTSGEATVYSAGREERVGAGLRRNIVYVPQGNTLMYGTIRDNLLLGNPDATEQMMLDAVRTAAADFVAELPNGLDSECFEGGVGFSEGQAQRLAIARGLLKGGEIILLDEPTSALDTATERELMRRLISRLPATYTVIIVTHSREVLPYCTDILDLTRVKPGAESS